MNQILKIIAVILSLCLCSCKTDDDPKQDSPDPNIGRMNLDFEVRSPRNALLPNNWETGGEGFFISLDNVEKYRGMLNLKMDWPIQFSNRKITDDFDYIVFIKTSSPSTLLQVQ